MNDTRRRVLDYIIEYKRSNDGLSPGYREIADAMGWASTCSVGDNLRELAERGLIELRGPGKPGIKVTGGSWQMSGPTRKDNQGTLAAILEMSIE